MKNKTQRNENRTPSGTERKGTNLEKRNGTALVGVKDMGFVTNVKQDKESRHIGGEGWM